MSVMDLNSTHFTWLFNSSINQNAWQTGVVLGLMRRSQIDGICNGICNGCLMGRWARDFVDQWFYPSTVHRCSLTTYTSHSTLSYMSYDANKLWYGVMP
jgi:hypothetical protein